MALEVKELTDFLEPLLLPFEPLDLKRLFPDPSWEPPNTDEGGGSAGVNDAAEEEGGGPAGVVEKFGANGFLGMPLGVLSNTLFGL